MPLSIWPAAADAVRTWPSCAVPEMVGVVTVGAASSTEPVAELVEETVTPLSLVTVATTWIRPPSLLSVTV